MKWAGSGTFCYREVGTARCAVREPRSAAQREPATIALLSIPSAKRGRGRRRRGIPTLLEVYHYRKIDDFGWNRDKLGTCVTGRSLRNCLCKTVSGCGS